jgi:hypothetical protein
MGKDLGDIVISPLKKDSCTPDSGVQYMYMHKYYESKWSPDARVPVDSLQYRYTSARRASREPRATSDRRLCSPMSASIHDQDEDIRDNICGWCHHRSHNSSRTYRTWWTTFMKHAGLTREFATAAL